jgi:hypothetical protein
VDAIFDCLGVGICVSVGYRYFGAEFWPQFWPGIPIATACFAISSTHESGTPPELWQAAGFAFIAAATMCALYYIDKRLKLTHWEKKPD